MELELVSICANMHVTGAEIVGAVINADGSVSGYTGSSAHYCDVCGSSNMTPLETRAK